jgi:hypothetical protein
MTDDSSVNKIMATDPLESAHPPQPAGHYRLGAIAFHWVMFVLVVIVGVLGLLHDSWPKQTQAFWINVHALIGIFLWLSLLARFGYRLRHSPPDIWHMRSSGSRVCTLLPPCGTALCCTMACSRECGLRDVSPSG